MQRCHTDPDDHTVDIEARIKRRLGDDKDDNAIADGINLIQAYYQDEVCGAIRKFYDGISSSDLDDIWQNTLLNVLDKARSAEFKSNGSLPALLKTIARCRAVDLLNKRERDRRGLQLFRQLVETLPTSYQVDSLTCDEIFHLIDEKIERLPHAQRRVWSTFRDLGFRMMGFEELRQAVRVATGYEGTEAAIRRAYQEGEKKVLQYLERKGYMR